MIQHLLPSPSRACIVPLFISNMADFTGKWSVASSDNFDAYLDAVGECYIYDIIASL